MYMQDQKNTITEPHGGGWFKWELKLLGLFLALVSFSNLIFSNNTFALFTPTLSASVDNAAISVNGNQVVVSNSKTTEIPFRLVVDTNNRTGYTISVNTETENTTLSNTNTVIGSEISSITENLSKDNLPSNTWGIKVGNSSTYAPIPALSTPSNLVQTDKKTNGSEINIVKVGMKLSENLEAGTYSNKLIFSFISNPYEKRAVLANSEKIRQQMSNNVWNQCTIHKERRGPDRRDIVSVVRFPKGYISNIRRITFNDWSNDEESSRLVSRCRDGGISDSRNEPHEFRLEDEIESDYAVYGFAYNGVLAIWSYDTERVYLNSNSSRLFSIFGNVKEINNMNKLNTELVTDMSSMFKNNSGLENLDLSSFDTRKVVDMREMFKDTHALEALNLYNFDTSKVTSMTEMFSGASALVSLDLSNFNTSNVTDMTSMFAKTANLKNLNLTSFNTEKVRNMSGMFYGSDSLTSLDLSSFNTKNVTNMSYMFFGMDEITTINIVNFDTQNVENVSYLFGTETGSVDHLTTIYVNNNFNTDKILQSDNIFMNRYQLRGGAGSFLANPSDADKTWLRIDDPTNNRPGYFTRKP